MVRERYRYHVLVEFKRKGEVTEYWSVQWKPLDEDREFECGLKGRLMGKRRRDFWQGEWQAQWPTCGKGCGLLTEVIGSEQ